MSKYLQTLAVGLIIFILCLPKSLHGCTVYVGLGSGTKKLTYISNNYVLLHGLRRSMVRTEKSTYISYIYVLYLALVSKYLQTLARSGTEKLTYISYIYILYLAQVSKYLQTLALGIIIFMLCLPKTLHGCRST